MIQKLNEVAPPGWGHTKAEKEKTKPREAEVKDRWHRSCDAEGTEAWRYS